jgi:hypothetical protein
MVEALGDLPIRSAVLDGELVLLNADGTANFYELLAEMRTRRADESRLRYTCSTCYMRMESNCGICRIASAGAISSASAGNHASPACA